MATTIEILLSSRFDASGFENAVAKVGEIASKMRGEFLTGETLEAFSGDVFPTGAVGRFADEMAEAEKVAKQLARAATELGDTKLAQKLIKKANAAKSLSERFSKLGALTRKEVTENFTRAGQSLDEMSKSLKKASEEEKKLAERLIKSGQRERAEIHLKNARAIDAERAALTKLDDELKDLTELQKRFGQFGDAFKDVSSVSQAKNKLEELRNTQISIRDEALKGGDLQAALNAKAAADEVQELDKALFGAHGAFQFLGKEAGVLGGVLQSTFNQLGFAIFVTTSSLRNLQSIIRGISDTLAKMADTAMFFNALSSAANKAGINMSALGSRTFRAAEGMLTYRDALSAVITLTNDGLPQFAEQADLFVSGAVSVAKLTGNLTTANDAYTAIIDSIRDADAANLENIAGLRRVATATKLAELRAEQYGEQLLDFEKRQIIVDELTDAIGELNDATADLEVAGKNAKLFGEALRTGFEGTGAVVLTLLGGIAGEFTTLETAGLEFARRFGVAIASLSGLLHTVIGVTLIEIAGIIKGIEERWQQLINLAEAGINFDLSAAKEALDDLGEGTDTGKKTRDAVAQYAEDIGQLVADKVEEINNALGTIPSAATEAGEDAAEGFISKFRRIADSIRESAIGSAYKALFNEIDALLGESPLEEFSNSIKEANQQLSDDLAEIKEDLAERLQDIWENYQEKLLEIDERGNERILDAEENLADKLEDIAEDLADKLEDIAEDAEDRREDAQKKHAKRLEKIEESHQKKLRDIQRKFDLARIKAIIDRDARALFEAERRRDEEIAAAQETADQQRKEARDNLEDQLEDIDDAEEKRRRRAQEAAEDRREDAIEAFEELREDILEQMQEQREELAKELAKQNKDAKEAADKRKKEAIKAFDEQVKALKESLKEQERELQLSLFRQRLDTIQEYGIMTSEAQNAFQTWLTDFQNFITDYDIASQDLIRLIQNLQNAGADQLPPLPEGGGDGDDGGGEPPPPPPPPPGPSCPPGGQVVDYNIAQGAGCLTPNQIYCAPNGIWICTPGGMQPYTSQTTTDNNFTGGTSTGGPNKFTGGNNFGGTGFSGGAGGQSIVPVTISVENDETLEAILEGISYRAFIRIME